MCLYLCTSNFVKKKKTNCKLFTFIVNNLQFVFFFIYLFLFIQPVRATQVIYRLKRV